ncbi:hypothetical protein SEA_TRAAWW1_131 [Mycobacterium phage Traaww1]|nr:hypothetical protein SEA_TRAAWW1_131 [Mycobacterium phage Traaww1]
MRTRNMSERVLANILADVTRKHGDKADVSNIAACHGALIKAYETGVRVRVEGEGLVRTGVVSRTTGWRPALLLMHRSNAQGSSDLLGPNDRITAVWDGRKYVPTKSGY